MRRTFPTRTDPPLTLAAWLRHDSIQRLLDGLEGVETILEIGAGEGALAARLATLFEYVGVEPDPSAYAKALERLQRLGRGTLVRRLDEVDSEREFDLVCAFEVLEHIADERSALSEWRRRLRPGGRLLLSVPAGTHRYGEADRHVGHYRRYDAGELERLLTDAGFAVSTIEHVGFPLGYVLEALRHVIARISRSGSSPEERTARSGSWLQPPRWLGWGTRAVTAPFRAVQRRSPATRLGTDLVVLASARSDRS